MKHTSAKLEETTTVAEPTDATPSKSKSKKRKAESSAVPESNANQYLVKDEPNEADATLDFSEIPGEEPVKRRKKKKKGKRVEAEEQELIEDIKIEEEHLESETENKQENGVIIDSWPADKIKTLLQRMRTEIPETDSMKYTSRIAKIDWNKVKFENFSASECEKMWKHVQKISRCYPILEEIIADAEDKLLKPSSTLNLSLQKRKHPDQPPKPLSSYMLFFLDKKEKVQRENPGANGVELGKRVGELWKSLKPKKLDKYKNKAQKLKEEYDRKMSEFWEEHPECVEESKKKSFKGEPKKPPPNAYSLYIAEKAGRWKALDDSKKEKYAEKLKKIQEEYTEKYKEYINSLSPEEREEEESKMKSNNKKKVRNQLKSTYNHVDEIKFEMLRENQLLAKSGTPRRLKAVSPSPIMTADNTKSAANSEKNQKNTSVIDLQSVTASNIKLTGSCYEKENGGTGNHLDETYDPFSNRETSHRTSDFGALVHLFKGSFGSGILAVPRAFKNSGLVFGLFGTVLVGMLCAHCVAVLVQCSHILSIRDKKPSLSFEQTAEVAFKTGPTGIRKYSTLARKFVTVSLFATYYLGNTVYIVLISEAFQDLAKNNLGIHLDIRVFIILVAFLVVPLGIGRTLKFLVPVSAFGILFIVFGLGVTCYYALSDIPPIIDRKYIAPIEELPVFLATIVFAMEGIGTVLPIERSMKNPDHFRGFCGVLGTAMTMIVILYSAIGFLGYLKYGEKTAPNITLNLPSDFWLTEIVKFLVALSILFTYGLQFCVPTEIVWDQIKHKVSSRHDNLAYYTMRGSLILGTVVIALIIPKLGAFIGIVGALCLATLGLFIPAVIEMVTFWEEDFAYWRLFKNIFIMLFSLMATISGCNVSIQEVIKSYMCTPGVDSHNVTMPC